MGECTPGLYRFAFDFRRRHQPTLLLKELQEGARADLAAVVGNEEAGAGDLVVLEEEHGGLRRQFQCEGVHRLLYRQFAEVRFPRCGGFLQQGFPKVLADPGGQHRQLVGRRPQRQILAGRRRVADHLLQHHIHQPHRPAGPEQQVERIGVGQRDQRPGIGQQNDISGRRHRPARSGRQCVQAIHHALRDRLGQARHRQMRLRHQQEQILLAVDTERGQGGMVVDPAQREVEQGPEVLGAAALGGFEGFDQVAKFRVEQRVDRRVRLGGDYLGPPEQVAVHGTREIDSACHRGTLES